MPTPGLNAYQEIEHLLSQIHNERLFRSANVSIRHRVDGLMRLTASFLLPPPSTIPPLSAATRPKHLHHRAQYRVILWPLLAQLLGTENEEESA
jgi:hypothetical protein